VQQDIAAMPTSTGTDDVHVCPGCLVPFVHAGGCSSMSCICGAMFTIEGLF
jgi:hypothetical protein